MVSAKRRANVRDPMTRVLLASLFLAAFLDCSSPSAAPPDGGTCAQYQVPPGTSLTSPVVSFGNDVLPIFKQSCGLSLSCHGGSAATTGRVFLGSNQVMTDPTMVHDGIVGVATIDLPSMPFVTAGDPSKSFLLHKMDGDQCLFDSQCVTLAGNPPGCGVSMPQDLPLLDVPSRDTVRRWIAQG
jgi:hypothetical protein